MGKPNTIIKEVSGIRQHRNYIWLIAAVLVGLLGGAAMLLAVSRSDNATLDEIAAARAALKSTALVPKETPDVTGFSLNILTDAVGASFFDTDETAAAEVDARIRARDAHLTEETGAAVAGAKYQINVCLNYGGRAEIADACAAIAKEVRDGKISGDRVTEKMIAEHLYNPDIPDCDLVIRTSGEQRTSNFLPWEAAYAELDFVPELFPDCGRDVLWRSIDHYIHRDRRFGGVKK